MLRLPKPSAQTLLARPPARPPACPPSRLSVSAALAHPFFEGSSRLSGSAALLGALTRQGSMLRLMAPGADARQLGRVMGQEVGWLEQRMVGGRVWVVK